MNNNTDKGIMLKGIRRIAEYYHSSTRSIQDLVNRGVIPTYRIGRNRYAYSNEIDEALKDRQEAAKFKHIGEIIPEFNQFKQPK